MTTSRTTAAVSRRTALAVLGGGAFALTRRSHGGVAQDATPSGAGAGVTTAELLVRAGIETPTEYNWMGVSRVAIAPGAELTTGSIEDWTGTGPYLAYVDAGTVRFESDGPAEWQGAGAASPVATTSQHAGPGDRLYAPNGVRVTWTNPGTDEAKLITFGALRGAGTGISIPDGVTYQDFMYTVTPLEPGPIDLRLERVTLAPGAALPGAPVPGLRMLGVEDGTVEVTWAKTGEPGVATGVPFAVEAPGTLDVNTERSYVLEIANRTDATATIQVLWVQAASGGEATPAAG